MFTKSYLNSMTDAELDRLIRLYEGVTAFAKEHACTLDQLVQEALERAEAQTRAA